VCQFGEKNPFRKSRHSDKESERLYDPRIQVSGRKESRGRTSTAQSKNSDKRRNPQKMWKFGGVTRLERQVAYELR
jgi:hypothetical protein